MLLTQAPTISPALPGPVLPEDTKPAYRAHASPSCTGWSAAQSPKTDDSRLRVAIYRNWVLGYVSGFNVSGPDPTGNLLGTSSPDQVFAAIDGYCARNPSGMVEDSMRPIAEAIVRRRGRLRLALPGADNPKRATLHAPTTCREWTAGGENALIRLAHKTLLYGYVTALNRWSTDPTGDALGADRDDILESWTDKWCGQHSDTLVIGAMAPLMDHVAVERAAGRMLPGGKRPSDVEGRD